MNEYTIITNIELFAKSVRKNAAMVFPKSYSDQINSLISIDQTKNLMKKYIEPSYNDEFIISSDNHRLLSNEIKRWIYNRSLSVVASSGEIECSWDDNFNDMIFWDPKSRETFTTIN